MSEEEFEYAMREMAAGNPDALKQVYLAYRTLIYTVCLKYLRQREQAEDVASEFFIKLFNSAGTFKANGHHKTWMCTIAKNMCTDLMRKEGHIAASLDDTPDEDGQVIEKADPASVGASSVEESTVNRLTIEEARKKLTDKEREVTDMKCSGLTFKEIAEITGMPQGTVSWHYNEAIKKLKRFIGYG